MLRASLQFLIGSVCMKTNEANIAETKFAIYQINPDRDVSRSMFLNTRSITEIFGDLSVDCGSYDRVYSGNISVTDLEDIYHIFNMDHPNDFRGRSLSVSDVVEVLDSPVLASGFYFCDSAGFTKISFEKELTQDSPCYNGKENTMEIYNVSFQKNDVYQARLVKAQSMEQAEAYFRHIEPGAEFIGISINQEGYKPGKPMEVVPEGWVAPETISAVIVEPGKAAFTVEIENRLDVLQSLVGGYIEVVPDFFFQDEKAAAIVNEEGKLEGLPFNRILYDSQGQHSELIAGPMVIVGSTEEEFCSLSPTQVNIYLEKFKYPQFMEVHQAEPQKGPQEKPQTLRQRREQARKAMDQLPPKKQAAPSRDERER